MSMIFLTFEEVLAIHADQIGRYGGSLGIRDVGLLHSALAQPQSAFGGQFVHVDLFEMAAAYLFHITSNHPFIDGNKRVGLVAAIVFIRMNDLGIKATNEELVELTLKVAQSQIKKNDIAEFFRAHAAN